jgi:hypothetical protein
MKGDKMMKSKKGKSGKSLSRRELLLKATKGAFVLGALQIGVPKAGAQPQPGTLDLRRKKNRDMVYRALTDPNFRKQIETNPAAALGKTPQQITEKNRAEMRKVLEIVKQVETKLAQLADELLWDRPYAERATFRTVEKVIAHHAFVQIGRVILPV